MAEIKVRTKKDRREPVQFIRPEDGGVVRATKNIQGNYLVIMT